jgi:hypothetical protein
MGKKLSSLKVMWLFLLTLLTLAACAQSPAEPADTPTPGGATGTTYPLSTKVAISPPATATTTSAAHATPTSTVCLDEATPAALPPRKTPLEVQFISDGNIWLWREEEGIAQRITHTGDARSLLFSNDGQAIAFIRGVNKYHTEIWAINRDGSNLRRLVNAADIDAMGSAPGAIANQPSLSHWISNTHTLVFSVSPVLDGIGEVKPYGMWVVDADTRVWRRYSPPASRLNLDAGMVSPDGRQIAMVTDTSLSLANIDGTNKRNHVLTFPHIGLGEYLYYPLIVWSHDSKSLRATTSSADPFAENATLSTWIIPADESPSQQLATFTGFPIEVHLSPNQQYIAFWKPIKYQSNWRELHLAKFDGSHEVTYYMEYALEFRGWAPDSVHFAFRVGPSGPPQLGQICGGFAPLVDVPTTGGIDWVDSARFIFSSGDEQSGELRLGQIGGPSRIIGPFNGAYATYQYNRDSAAVGQSN